VSYKALPLIPSAFTCAQKLVWLPGTWIFYGLQLVPSLTRQSDGRYSGNVGKVFTIDIFLQWIDQLKVFVHETEL
jgi:hypothetical protein